MKYLLSTTLMMVLTFGYSQLLPEDVDNFYGVIVGYSVLNSQLEIEYMNLPTKGVSLTQFRSNLDKYQSDLGLYDTAFDYYQERLTTALQQMRSEQNVTVEYRSVERLIRYASCVKRLVSYYATVGPDIKSKEAILNGFSDSRNTYGTCYTFVEISKDLWELSHY